MDYVGGAWSLGIKYFNAVLKKLRFATGGFIASWFATAIIRVKRLFWVLSCTEVML